MKHRLFTIILFAGIITTLLQSCHNSEAMEQTGKDSAVEEASTVVTLVKKGKVSSEITVPGELQPFQQVDLYAKINSYVKKLYADVGSEVKQGQLLAVMEAPEINSQLAASESKLKSYEAIYIASKANYDRLVETSKTPGTISPNDLDQALSRQKSDYAQYEAAQSAYNEVINTRDYLQIKAPFSGVVTARNVSQGAYVGPSGKGSDQPLFTLQTQKELRLVVYVPEAYTGYLDHKDEISFTVVSMPGQIFKAQVKRMAGSLDQKLRSERMEMDVVNNDKKLLPGMITQIIIPLTARDSTLIVPATAVVNSTEKVYVVKVVNNKAMWVEVKEGKKSDKEIEIFGNLSQGDTVVTAANEEVRDGMPLSKTKLAESN